MIKLAQRVGIKLKRAGLILTTAESCTGGLLAASITAIPGSSAYFDCGFVVYSNQAKKTSLGVKESSLKKFGAVSESGSGSTTATTAIIAGSVVGGVVVLGVTAVSIVYICRKIAAPRVIVTEPISSNAVVGGVVAPEEDTSSKY